MIYYDFFGNQISTVYDFYGNAISSGDDVWETEYQHQILIARDAWIAEARADSSVLPVAIHTDQHGKLTATNTLFPYLALAIPWADASAIIGLGDVPTTYWSEVISQRMETCLDDLPTAKKINIIGNHDTWVSDSGVRTLNDSEWETMMNYFDNSGYNGHHAYDGRGTEYMIDSAHGVKYVTFGGWYYDTELGNHSHYVITSDEMDNIIAMLSAADGYDIVMLTHAQPFSAQNAWTIPYADAGTPSEISTFDTVVNADDTSIDQMLFDRKNKRSGTVKDSYGNSHAYDFSGCNSDLLCCLSGHQHLDAYQIFNGNIPVVEFDAYAYDTHPFYFVNVDRTQKRIHVWRVDDTPQIVEWAIPFETPVVNAGKFDSAVFDTDVFG